MSDVPIRFSRKMRARLLAASKVRGGPAAYLKVLKGFSLSELAPEAPAIAEFSTGEVMGASADRLAARWGVSRIAQDEFAVRSHAAAAKASADGLLQDRLQVGAPAPSTADNGVRGDSTLESLSGRLFFSKKK